MRHPIFISISHFQFRKCLSKGKNHSKWKKKNNPKISCIIQEFFFFLLLNTLNAMSFLGSIQLFQLIDLLKHLLFPSTLQNSRWEYPCEKRQVLQFYRIEAMCCLHSAMCCWIRPVSPWLTQHCQIGFDSCTDSSLPHTAIISPAPSSAGQCTQCCPMPPLPSPENSDWIPCQLQLHLAPHTWSSVQSHSIHRISHRCRDLWQQLPQLPHHQIFRPVRSPGPRSMGPGVELPCSRTSTISYQISFKMKITCYMYCASLLGYMC